MFFDLHLIRRAKSQRKNPRSQSPNPRQISIAKFQKEQSLASLESLSSLIIGDMCKNCIPKISAIRVIRGHDFWDLVPGVWDLLPQAVSMVESNPAGLNGCD